MRRLAALLMLAALAGCSSSGGTAKKPPRSSSAAAYRPGPADDAAIVALHITGCSGVKAGDGASGDLTSTATCTLEGHLMSVDVWRRDGLSKLSAALTGGHVAFAYGPRWTVFAGDGVPLATQRLLAGVVAKALGGQSTTT